MSARGARLARLFGLGLLLLVPSLLFLGASHARSAPAFPAGPAPVVGERQPLSLDLPVSATPHVGEEARPAVRLRILDAESGRCVPRASVVSFVTAPAGAVRRLETGCDGEGGWSGAPLSDRPFFVRAPGYVDQDVRATLAGPPREHEVRLRSMALRTVELVVVDAGGRPVPGAEVRLCRPATMSATTDDDGRVALRLAGDAPSLRIQGEAEAHGFVLRPFDALDDGRGALCVWNRGLAEEAGAVVLDRTASAYGCVVDAGDARRAGVRVRVSERPLPPMAGGCGDGGVGQAEWSTTSDAAGAYALADLPAGRPLYWCLGEGPASQEPSVLAAGATRRDWRLAESAGPSR